MSRTKQRTARSVHEMMGLSRLVGGKAGAALRRFVLAASQGGGPDLTIRTRKPVSAQAAAYLESLGSFQPDAVSIATMKRMRLDPQIQLALAATKSPILEAPVFFESVSREAVALCDAAWVESGVLRELQRTSLNAIDFGFAPHEKVWEAAENFEIHWTTPGRTVGVMEQRSKTYPIAFLPKRTKDLDPALVTILTDEYGRFQGLYYGTPPVTMDEVRKNSDNYLPPEKAFLFTLNEEFSNPYGRARLVSSYDPWYWQRIIYLTTNRWYERKADPSIVGFAPADPLLLDPGTSEDTDFDPDDEQHSPILRMRSLLTNGLRSSGVIVLPSEPYKSDDGKPSTVRAYDLKELGVEDVHPAFLAYLQHLDSKKTRGLLVPDGAIAASENSGTYGSTRTLSDLAIKIQNETLSAFVRHFNRYFLAPFLAYNGIKDRVTLRTTGISADNRDVLLKLAEKTYEADMLLEQAWGPQFPDSLTRLVSRRRLLRSLNIPYEEPDPGAPPPEMPEPPPQPVPAAGQAKAKASEGTKGKTKSGLSRKETHAGDPSRRERPFRLAVASPEFEAWATEKADAFVQRAVNAAQHAPYRDQLTTREKAIAAIILWYLLRADKTDAKGKKVKGVPSVDDFVFEPGSHVFATPDKLAEALNDLEAVASDYEGKGYRLLPSGTTKTYLKRAEAGIAGMMDALPSDLADTLDPNVYLRPAIEDAHAAMRNLIERFDTSRADAFTALDAAAMDEILALNARGLLWNIENIGIRNRRSAIERLINGTGNRRRLGVIQDAASTRFNRLYTDLSLEAHYRAVFRAAIVELAQRNGTPTCSWCPRAGRRTTRAASTAGRFGRSRSGTLWPRIRASPTPSGSSGSTPARSLIGLPVPGRERQRPGVDLALRYLTAKRKTVDTPQP